jgi:cytochrome oxidase Cu insertion factor (SCO1/SenC/PrrC family)
VKERFGAAANFLLVYVREAHASDEWVMEDNVKAGISLPQPRTTEERAAVAAVCCEELRSTIPAVVDGIDDAVAIPWGAWPERLYVLDAEGVVIYRGGPGTWGFVPEEVAAVLADL